MSTAKRKKRSSSLKGSLNPSKRHRDRFNVELDNLAKLLPFPNDVIQKLDKLSILRLSASYLRAKNFFKEQHWTDNNEQSSSEKAVAKKDFNLEGNGIFSKLLLEALDGFVIVLTQDYELFYASETIQEYLGLSQSSVIHQDFLRFIHVDDHDLIRRNLQPHLEEAEEKKIKILDDENDGDPSRTPKRDEETSSETGSLSKEVHTERTFVCRMKCILNTSAGFFKPFKCNGRLREMTLADSDKRDYGLFLICTPMETMTSSILEIRLKTSLFCSKNRMDLSFVDIDQKGRALLGYHKRDIALQSSYCMIHFEDIAVLKTLHVDLMSAGKCQGTFRLLNKNMKWQWLTGTAQVVFKGNEPDFVITTNRPLSEEEGEEVLRQRGQHTPALQFTTSDNNLSPKGNNSLSYLMDTGKNDQSFKYPAVSPKFFPDNKKRSQPLNVNAGNGLHHQGYFNRGPPFSGTDGTLSPQANLSSFSDDGFSSTACTSAPDSPEDLNLGVDLQDELMTDESDFSAFLSQDFPLGDTDPIFDPAKDTDLVDHMSHLAMDPSLGDLPTLEETLALMQNCISSDSESTAPSLRSPDGSYVSAPSPPHVNCDPFSPTSSVGQPSPFLSPVGPQGSGPAMMSPSGLPTPDPSPLGKREGDAARVNISWQGVSKGRPLNQMQQQHRHPLPQQQQQQQHSPYGQCSPNYQPNMNPPNGNVLSSKSAYMAAVKKREMENYSNCVGSATSSVSPGHTVPSSWRMQQCSPTSQQGNMQNNYHNWNGGYQQGYRPMNPMHGEDNLIGNVPTHDPTWNQGLQGAMSVPPSFEDTLPNLDYPGSNVLSPPYHCEGMPGYGFQNKVTVTSVSKHGEW